MEETKMRTFHVVCRECRTERLLDSDVDARKFADGHTAETGHVVDLDRVA